MDSITNNFFWLSYSRIPNNWKKIPNKAKASEKLRVDKDLLCMRIQNEADKTKRKMIYTYSWLLIDLIDLE